MGKTKTVLITDTKSEQKSGKEAYEEKMRKKQEALKKEEAEKKKVSGLGLKGGERIKIIGSETTEPTPSAEKIEEEVKNVKKKVKVRGKKYQENKSKIDRDKLYPLPEAVKTVKETSYSKFDGTMEVHIVVKKTGLSASIDLPYSTGKTKKIEIASDKTINQLKKISEGKGSKLDFDILLATADMMPKLVKFAKILGPKGLMPNPKSGTLIKSTKEADKFKGNSVQIKTEKDSPIIHTVIGKVSQKDEELTKNLEAVFDGIGKKQIQKAYLKSTMSPSVKLAI